MYLYFFVLIASILVNFVTIIPFINLLYKLKFQRADQTTRDAFNRLTPIFDKFNKHKTGTPVGGGLLIIINTVGLFAISLLFFKLTDSRFFTNYQSIVSEIKILLFTFVSFSFLGLYDDLKKIFLWKDEKFFGLRLNHKLILETILGLSVGFWLYKDLNIDLINIPYIDVLHISWLYIPFAAFVIVAFANAVNITDGLDGLAAGVLVITLFALWTISVSILDTPLSLFIACWLGGLITFLYFNIYPARIFMGDTGALSFGATFAVIGLLLGKVFALPIMGGVFVFEIASSAIQLLSRKYRGKKIFIASPIHLYLQQLGWPEPKIVMRAWVFSILFALFGLMIAFANRPQ